MTLGGGGTIASWPRTCCCRCCCWPHAAGRGLSGWSFWQAFWSPRRFLAAYDELAPPQFAEDQARIDTFAAQTAGTLVYQAQGDPWCNTILLPFETAFLPEVLAIPAGIAFPSILTSPDVAS